MLILVGVSFKDMPCFMVAAEVKSCSVTTDEGGTDNSATVDEDTLAITQKDDESDEPENNDSTDDSRPNVPLQVCNNCYYERYIYIFIHRLLYCV